ncbi:hypothetical protein PR048_018387 [Dryococelus australis]|uniref:Uncharacterized protein n=1 Tax=Dryococelus australis TaxID=614101 RepID=A0ABQ9HCI7_9NEOP|nr:hypothetical protein PR048_018387 [Dryococelus australis]
MLRKMPRTNTPQVQLQRNQRLQATSDSVAGSKTPVVKKNPINITKVSKSTPSNTVKTTRLGSGVNVKPRQALGVNKTRINPNNSIDVQVEMSCKNEEQSVEGCIANTLREKQETEARFRQNTDILATPVKRIITNTRNVWKARPKLQHVSKGGTSVSVSKSVSVGGSTPGLTGSAGTVQSKSILKKSGFQENKNIMRSEHLTASTSGPTTKGNFVLYTDGIVSDDSLPVTENHTVDKSRVVSLINTHKNNAAHTIVKKQHIVRKPMILPVLDTDDTDSLNEESTVVQEHASQSQSSTDENSPTQDEPVIHQNFRRLGSHSTSKETASSGVTRANVSRPAVEKKNIVSLRSVKYGSEPVVQPASKVRRLPPEYEGKYKIIMPKGWVPYKQATWKDNHGGE